MYASVSLGGIQTDDDTHTHTCTQTLSVVQGVEAYGKADANQMSVA